MLHSLKGIMIEKIKCDLDFYPLETTDIADGNLQLQSYIKCDKYFTLNSELVDKRLASINGDLMKKLKALFCNEI